MRNLFALVGLVVVLFLGLGWYLNWYRLDWTTGSDGRTKVGLDVDTNKVSGDLKSGVHKAGELLKSNPGSNGADLQAEDPNFVGPPAPREQDKPAATPTTPATIRPTSSPK